LDLIFFIDNNMLQEVYIAVMQLRGRKLLDSRWLLAALAMLWVGAAQAGSEVVGVRLGIHDDSTRIVLDLTGAPIYEISTPEPTRLVIDLAGVDWHLPGGAPPAGRGLIKAIHVDPGLEGHSQLILELESPVRVRAHDVLAASGTAPTRLFVDLVKGPATAPAAPPATVAEVPPPPAPAPESSSSGNPFKSAKAAPLSEPPPPPAAPAAAVVPVEEEVSPPVDQQAFIPPLKPTPPQTAPAAAAEPAAGGPGSGVSLVAMTVSPALLPPAKPPLPEDNRKPVIVLDAGHGGKDPGATGVDGTMEKDITLRMARELKRLLEASGRYKVVLTRTDDTLLPLRRRFDIARLAGADLFISLHADHNDNKRLRGASVYTLSENASDAEAAALAARENKEDLINGVDLSNQSAVVTSILIDLAQRETKNRSARFASLLTEEMADQTLVLRESHRFAGFAVLKAPDVPSVLIELGYLSNENDEAALRSARHRTRIGKAIEQAIDQYFEWQRSVRPS
jgi:N-acetylmuramoyl-L-alanine amidase